MKLLIQNRNHRRNERGFFLTIVLLILTTIMLIYIAANGRRLATLNRQIRAVEQKQFQRLDRSSAVVSTNTVVGATPPVALK